MKNKLFLLTMAFLVIITSILAQDSIQVQDQLKQDTSAVSCTYPFNVQPQESPISRAWDWVYDWVPRLVTLFSVISLFTKTPKDDEAASKLAKLINIGSLNKHYFR